LPFEDGSFDRAYSLSVLEHIPAGGDREALGELARVVTPDGRVVLTLPYAERYHEDWREAPLYGQREATNGSFFFERWYDKEHLDALLAAVPELRVLRRSVVRMSPNWHRAYLRAFPWLVPLGPLFGLLGTERQGPPGDVVRVTLCRTG
jgi:SAM-dependent methyltransferase